MLQHSIKKKLSIYQLVDSQWHEIGHVVFLGEDADQSAYEAEIKLMQGLKNDGRATIACADNTMVCIDSASGPVKTKIVQLEEKGQ